MQQIVKIKNRGKKGGEILCVDEILKKKVREADRPTLTVVCKSIVILYESRRRNGILVVDFTCVVLFFRCLCSVGGMCYRH